MLFRSLQTQEAESEATPGTHRLLATLLNLRRMVPVRRLRWGRRRICSWCIAAIAKVRAIRSTLLRSGGISRKMLFDLRTFPRSTCSESSSPSRRSNSRPSRDPDAIHSPDRHGILADRQPETPRRPNIGANPRSVTIVDGLRPIFFAHFHASNQGALLLWRFPPLKCVQA